MTYKSSKLMESLSHYSDMQQAHLKSFETELIPDIEKQNFERSKAFQELKNLLNQEIGNINAEEEDLNLVKLYSERITSILSFEDLLKERIMKYKKELLSHMKQIQHGKKAMKGYGQLGNSNSPKIMSKSG